LEHSKEPLLGQKELGASKRVEWATLE